MKVLYNLMYFGETAYNNILKRKVYYSTLLMRRKERREKEKMKKLKEKLSKNSIFVIAPYRWEGTWVFDDDSVGLKRELFVNGIPEMIEFLIKENGFPEETNKFRLVFAANPFPNYQFVVNKTDSYMGGTYYELETPEMVGWLCPALLKYFDSPPEQIYVKAELING